MGKYEPLSTYLSALPEVQSSHRLRLEQIDELLGRPLPQTARTDRTWWANTEGSNHARSWLTAGWKVRSMDVREGTVEFGRTDAAGKAGKSNGREASFPKLHQFFLSLPAEQHQIALNFYDIETIVGRKLPPTALADRTWWANAGNYEPARFWMSAGWRVEAAYMKAGLIVFRRKGTAVLEMIRHWVKRYLEGGTVVGGPDARTLAQWVRDCRRVHWYFEGAILFERSGVSFGELDELIGSDLAEDYEVCRRELNRHRQGQIASA